MHPTLASEALRCAFIQSLTHRLMQTLAPADAKACIAIRIARCKRLHVSPHLEYLRNKSI